MPLLLQLTLIIAAILIVAAVLVLADGWLRRSGTRVITCPDTGETEGVEIDAFRGAVADVFRPVPHLRLKDCSRWPEKQDCDQACIHQIEQAPDGCRLQTLLERWYEGKTCFWCEKTFAFIHWHDHRPALRSPEGKLVEWSDVEPEDVYSTLDTHAPVCFNCFIAESFRHEHPDMVVNRNWDRDAGGEYHRHTH